MLESDRQERGHHVSVRLERRYPQHELPVGAVSAAFRSAIEWLRRDADSTPLHCQFDHGDGASEWKDCSLDEVSFFRVIEHKPGIVVVDFADAVSFTSITVSGGRDWLMIETRAETHDVASHLLQLMACGLGLGDSAPANEPVGNGLHASEPGGAHRRSAAGHPPAAEGARHRVPQERVNLISSIVTLAAAVISLVASMKLDTSAIAKAVTAFADLRLLGTTVGSVVLAIVAGVLANALTRLLARAWNGMAKQRS